MNPSKFVTKWEKVSLKEISASQSHFNDICALIGHPNPVTADPHGEFFTFEEPAKKESGKTGRADAWFKGKFIWEYKGVHADLDEAYNQLLLYRDSLGNPPLLITSDMHKIIVHTNFTNTVKDVYTIDFDSIKDGSGIEILRRVFYEPETFKPSKTQEQITKATAESFLAITRIIESWADKEEYVPEKVAHFIGRLFFSLFAEDMGLLPENVITDLAGNEELSMDEFSRGLKTLFSTMRSGGVYGTLHIRNFDGTLFDDNFMPELLTGDIKDKLYEAARQDWTGIDPSIFGTLFERVIDKSKRSQLGLHYTSKDDIMLVVEPVVMKPLLEKWYSVKSEAEDSIRKDDKEKAHKALTDFSKYLGEVKVLDPACGSGNFLYVALQQLLNLQKEVIVLATKYGFTDVELTVSPNQLYGIEKDLYAHELAQITVWIGYIQWRVENGFGDFSDPILKPLHNIRQGDAILEFSEDEKPIEPEWPDVDFIIGNPPFLGSRKMVPELGNEYCSDLRQIYKDRIEGYPDLVCYWFEKAGELVENGKTLRVGLLATQGIRGGTNRGVLDKIVKQGEIFMAWSDKDWVLDGATVHVSIVGFDMGQEKEKYLDGQKVSHINSDLTSSSFDLTKAEPLKENLGISYQGVVLRGRFNISKQEAEAMLKLKNPSGLENSDVIKPRRTGRDVLHKSEESFVIDFGLMSSDKASKYQGPFEYVKTNVYPERQKAPQKEARENWWTHWRTRTEMKNLLSKIKRYIATPTVAKHRVFVWLDSKIIPDVQLIAFMRSDDYFFGVLHSKVHELWARKKGTQLRDAESGFRYTPTTTFETFPMPWPPGKEPESESMNKISEASRTLIEFRDAWLNPPKEDIGITISQSDVDKKTLTNLYNALSIYRNEFKNKDDSQKKWKKEVENLISLQEIAELDFLHNNLDDVVLEAYGLSTSVSDNQILEHLLKLNSERAKL